MEEMMTNYIRARDLVNKNRTVKDVWSMLRLPLRRIQVQPAPSDATDNAPNGTNGANGNNGTDSGSGVNSGDGGRSKTERKTGGRVGRGGRGGENGKRYTVPISESVEYDSPGGWRYVLLSRVEGQSKWVEAADIILNRRAALLAR